MHVITPDLARVAYGNEEIAIRAEQQGLRKGPGLSYGKGNDFDGIGASNMKSVHTRFVIVVVLLAPLHVAAQNTAPSLNSNASANGLRSHHSQCSNETLQGRYAFRSEATPVSGGKRLNLALIEFHGSVQGPIIAKEDGSEYYFLRTNPANLMLAGTGTRINRSRSDEHH